MADNTLPGGHIVSRDADLGEGPATPGAPAGSGIPTPQQLAEANLDARQGDAISDQATADQATHEQAYDAAAWDEQTDDQEVRRD